AVSENMWAGNSIYINVSEWSEVRSFSVVNYNLNRGVTSRVAANVSPSDISADGRYIVVRLLTENGIFVRDRVTNQYVRVSVNSQGVASNQSVYGGSISDDGRYVVFTSTATNLAPDDSGGRRDVFLHDRQTGETRRISVNAQGIEGNQNSLDAIISSDGRYVVFTSTATNLVPNDTNGMQDIFIYDTQTGQITLVSASSAGVIGNNNSGYPSISNDGRYVLFVSQASNLVASDTDINYDIYIKDMQTGQLTLESLNHAGDKLTSA
ncbi:MAG TPA: hypothetical protein PLZ51_13085, partial [Aggregatilineales bacterium]|nr:hypothetical protein [Aggregatilineales bacterium]